MTLERAPGRAVRRVGVARLLLPPPAAMRMPRVRDLPAPYVTALLLCLLVLAVVTWSRGGGGQGTNVAKVSRTRAKLYDGQCVFAADVELRSGWGQLAFARHYLDVRDAMVDVLRTKSRYMVSSGAARESLRWQLVAAVNGVIGDGRATRLQFTEFRLL